MLLSIAGTGPDLILRRRLSDCIAAYHLAAVQLHLFEREGGPHHATQLEMRIARLHRRMDDLEARLRAAAVERGLDPKLPTSQLIRQLRTCLARDSGNGRRSEDSP